MFRNTARRLAALLGLSLALSGLSHAQTSLPKYKVINLGTLPGDLCSRAYDVNDVGQVVGISLPTRDWSGSVHATLWQINAAGAVTTINIGAAATAKFGGLYNSAAAINNPRYDEYGSLLRPAQVVGGANRLINGTNYQFPMFWSDTNNNNQAEPEEVKDLHEEMLDPALKAEGWVITSTRSINDSGQITGSGYRMVNGATVYSRAITYQLDATSTRVISIAETSVNALAINENGVVAGGAFFGGSTIQHAAAFVPSEPNGTSFTAIELVAQTGGSSMAYDINNQDWVVGESKNSAGIMVPTLWAGGTCTLLGASFGQARGLNDLGHVVGILDSSKANSAFLWRSGQEGIIDLNRCKVQGEVTMVLQWGDAINERGQIVGFGSTNRKRAFLLTPVP